MTLLEFARGPALQGSLIIMLVAVMWRLFGIVFLRRKKDYSAARAGLSAQSWGAVKTIFNRFVPKATFWPTTRYSMIMGYAFHIGLAVVVFGYTQHIAFIEDLTGLSWAGLPTGIITAASVVTVAAMVGILVRRLSNPVVRLISNPDDYLAWIVTVLPVITGLMAAGHWFPKYYDLTLAIHILSVCLLFIWLPFGKLAHAYLFLVSRATTGALFARKGAST